MDNEPQMAYDSIKSFMDVMVDFKKHLCKETTFENVEHFGCIVYHFHCPFYFRPKFTKNGSNLKHNY